jgi:hypothetical protein
MGGSTVWPVAAGSPSCDLIAVIVHSEFIGIGTAEVSTQSHSLTSSPPVLFDVALTGLQPMDNALASPCLMDCHA